MRKKAPKKLA